MAVANAGNLSVTISAIDLFTKPLRTLNREVAGTSRRLGLSLRPLTTGARMASRSLSQIVPPLAAITGAGTIAGLYRLASGWAAFGSQLQRDAYRAQSTVANLGRLQGAARLAGATAEDATAGLIGLGDALLDAAGGRDDTAVQYFRLLGVNLRDAAGNARTAGDALPEVADGIARIGDPRLQARVMAALRLPAGLLPFLKEGAAGLREYQRVADETGASNNINAEAARRFEMAQTRLSLSGTGLANVFAARLAPALTPVVNGLADGIVWSGRQAAPVLDSLISRTEAWVAGGALDRIGSDLSVAGRYARELSSGLSEIAFPNGVGTEIENATRTFSSWVTTVRAFADTPLGRWWFDRDKATRNSWDMGGPIGTLDDQANQQERDAAKAAPVAPGAQWSQGWSALQSLLQQALGNPLESRIQAISGGPASGFANRAGRAAQREAGPDTRRSYTDEEASANQRAAYDRLTKVHNWSPEAAAGIVANMRHESGRGLDPNAVGDGGRAYGIGQWHPDRQAAFARFAGKDIRLSTRDEQIDFYHHELTAGEDRQAREAGRRLRASRLTAGEAARAVSEDHERPALRDAEAAARARTAEAMLPQLRRGQGGPAAAFQGLPAVPGTAATGLPPAAAPAPSRIPGLPAAPRSSDLPAAPPRSPTLDNERGEEPAANPSLRSPAQQVNVRVTLAGPGTEGATIRTETPDGNVRVQRQLMGVTP